MPNREKSLRLAHTNLPWSTAIVTGCSSGIGEGLTRALVAGGVRVLAIARRVEGLEHLARELGEKCVPLALDVDDTDALVAAMRAFDTRSGGVDLVIANAGVGAPASLPATSYEATRAALHTNFCGAAATLTALTDAMIARGRGHLVAISSLASFGALPASLAYCAPKAGLNMVGDCLRVDLLPRGIAVTNVYLGFVKTPMVAASTHPMPQLISVTRAVDVVLDRLRARPATITYPRLLATGAALLAALPERLRRMLFARQTWSA